VHMARIPLSLGATFSVAATVGAHKLRSMLE
jgi:hypothetical protein